MKFQLVLASIFFCLLQTDVLAQQTDIGALVERTVERVRQQFPADADERIGSYRTAYLRIGTATQIQSLIPKSPETNIQAVSTQLIRDWFSANPDAYKEILEFARMQGIATSEIAAVVRNSGLHAIKLGRYEEGERLLSLLPAFPSGQHDRFDLIIAYASGRDFSSADKKLPEILENVSVNSAPQIAHQFASLGYVQGAIGVIEKVRDRREMLYVVAAALKGAAARKERVDISGLVRFIDAAQLEKLTVDDLTDDKNSSWSRALEPCEPARKLLFPRGRPPLLAHVPINPPIRDCFTTPPGPIVSLAFSLFKAGEKKLAEAILDRVATLLVATVTPENIEVYRSALFPRPGTRPDIELFRRMETYLSSLGNVARLTAAMEFVSVGRKVLPALKSADHLRLEFLPAYFSDPSLINRELFEWPRQQDREIEILKLELALRQNDIPGALRSFDNLKNGGKWSEGLAHVYSYHMQHPNSATEATRDHFLKGVRNDLRDKSLLSVPYPHFAIEHYLSYVAAFGDRDLARDLARNRFTLAVDETAASASGEIGRASFNLILAVADCFYFEAGCGLDTIRFGDDQKKSADAFNASLTDVLARFGQIDNALSHVQRMSQPFPDSKAYPDYLREAWGHLAHAYARQGKIDEALAIIGEGKAGKPGGTIDAVVDGWIAAGHYKRQ